MADVPISLISTEDLAQDFVWLKRGTAFTSIRRPTLAQCVPVDLTPYTLSMVVYNDRGVVFTVPSLAVSKADAVNGLMQVTAPQASVALCKDKILHYHLLATLSGVTKQVFGGPFTVTAA